jgi:integrase
LACHSRKRLWAHCPANPLTGCRRDEMGSLQWPEIDLKEKAITLPSERTKNKQLHVVPLPDNGIAILKQIPQRATREFVFGIGQGGFSGWSKSKRNSTKRRNSKSPAARCAPAWASLAFSRTLPRQRLVIYLRNSFAPMTATPMRQRNETHSIGGRRILRSPSAKPASSAARVL